MGQFDTAGEVESLVWQFRLADFPRSQNRALINNLANGVAPYSQRDATEMNLAVNFNDLTAPRMLHDARRQFNGAYQKPASFFSVRLDSGAIHKRGDWSSIITKELNKRLKRSLPYFETLRSTWANVVLHGIAPSVWYDKERWCPRAKGVEDVLVPSNTLVSLENLEMFAVWESYTPMELIKMTSGPNVDKAWNMDLVNTVLKHAQDQVLDFGISNAEIYSPEKQVERLKMDSGLYAADSLATIDTWAFYFWNDEDNVSGWNKRVILDSNWQGGAGPIGYTAKDVSNLKSKFDTKEAFLYNPKKRKYANHHSEIIHFQFGDLSAVGPFRYHSVRSLGYLLYAACNLLNRLRCKFLDSTFEQLQQYYRVTNKDDVQRALMIDLIDKGFIDESVKFVPPGERWQINQQLADSAFQNLGGLIQQNASIYREGQDYGAKTPEKTATQVMAEVNAATALIGAALQQSYQYQTFQYREIARRFAKPNSKDADVRAFRVACFKQGVPKKYLDNVDCWEIEPEKVVGGGNRMMEMAIGDKLMSMFQLFSPESQRMILKQVTLWITEDAGWTQELVPDDQNRMSPSKHDAQLMMGSLMAGLPVTPTPQSNYEEVLQTLLGEAGLIVGRIEKLKGGMPSMDEFIGLQNVAQHIGIYLQLFARDKSAAEKAKEYADALGKLKNALKAFQQRLQEKAKAEAQSNGQPKLDPKDAAKIQATMLTAKAKAQNTRESHAQRTAQRETQFALEQRRKAEEFKQTLAERQTEHAIDTMHEVKKSRMKTMSE